MARNQLTAATVCLIILTCLMTVGGLYLGATFLVPIAIALVLNSLFRPDVRTFSRLHVPAAISGALVVLGLLAALTGLVFALYMPIKAWVAKAPQNFAAAEQKLARLKEPLQQVNDLQKKIQTVTQGSTTAPASQQASDEPESVALAAPKPEGIAGAFLQVVGGGSEVIVLLYLLLAGGGIYSAKILKILPASANREVAHGAFREAEVVVRRYVGVTALINLGQAGVIALTMWAIGLPAPVLWGVFTFVFEFVPYIGAAVMVVLLSIVSLATFDTIGQCLLAPIAYLAITTLQNNLVSPIAYGKKLALNPVTVLLGVVFFWFVWGHAGAFIAVPVIATLRVIADRVPWLESFAEILRE